MRTEAPLPPLAPGADASVLRAPGDDLQPGTVRAFGLLMPVGTVERISTSDSRMFYVQAPMSRVMRYLQRRLEFVTAEIHPLGAMVRNARVRAAPAGERFILDVGVRDEGERTMVSIWNRTPVTVPPRSLDEGFRAAGFDPRTGRPLPENNN